MSTQRPREGSEPAGRGRAPSELPQEWVLQVRAASDSGCVQAEIDTWTLAPSLAAISDDQGFITTLVHHVHSIHPGDPMGCGAGLPLRMKEWHPPASVLAQLSGCSGIKGVVYLY